MQSLTIRRTRQQQLLRILSVVVCGGMLAVGGRSIPVQAEEASAGSVSEPFVVVAIASVDRFLEDLDAVAESIGQPNYAKFVRGFLSGMNDLRGFDRTRPLGALMDLPPGDSVDARPLFFFPMTDLDELLKTVRFGESFRLKRDKSTHSLILQTEDAQLPVVIQHGFAFLGDEQAVQGAEQKLWDPAVLLGDSAGADDVVVMLRRAGIPLSTIEKVQRDLQADADEELVQQADESDADYELRREFSTHVYGLVSAAVREWQSATAGLNFAADTGALSLNIDLTVEEDGELGQLLLTLPGPGSRFERILNEPAPLTVSTSFTLPEEARGLARQLLSSIQTSVDAELHDDAEPLRSAVFGMMESVRKSVDAGHFDVYGQLISRADNRFVLTGGIGIADADRFASCLREVLPTLVQAEGIREVQLEVASPHGIEIHRLIPAKVRQHDRLLYGDGAAIYLAAGRGAIWLAVGDDQAISALESAMAEVDESPVRPAVVPPALEGASPHGNSRSLLSVTIHLSQWARFLESHDGMNAEGLASLMSAAFPDSTRDAAHLEVHATPTGVKMRVDFAEGYARLLGLVIARRLHSDNR